MQNQTYDNLMSAFAGECQAAIKYEFFEKKARKDGYEQIANIFKETAKNEKAHAYMWFKHLQDGNIKTTDINLKDASNGEHSEWSKIYKDFAKTATEEGLLDIAKQFENVADIENAHQKRYDDLSQNIASNLVFKKDTQTEWHCLNCGHHLSNTNAPEVCPVCSHPQAYFEVNVKNY